MGSSASPDEQNRIRRNILKKLYAYGAFAHGHLLFERLQSGIPRHLAGFVADILDELVKEGLVLHYGRTKHGDAYQLNIKMLKEIEEILFGDSNEANP